ncbi:hypothetical protein STEG23_005374 [Scotinomys teguina]
MFKAILNTARHWIAFNPRKQKSIEKARGPGTKGIKFWLSFEAYINSSSEIHLGEDSETSSSEETRSTEKIARAKKPIHVLDNNFISNDSFLYELAVLIDMSFSRVPVMLFVL